MQGIAPLRFASPSFAGQSRKQPLSAPQFGANYNVLVAEDEPLTRTMVAGYFHNASDAQDTFTVTTANNLEAGKKALAEKDIDLLWTDNNMPFGDDGLALLNYAKTVNHPPQRSVLFSSPREMSAEELESKAKEAGANEFFNKDEHTGPLNIRLLVMRVLGDWLDRSFAHLPKSPRPSRQVSRQNSFLDPQ